MYYGTQVISVKGRRRLVPAIKDADVVLAVTGKLLKIAEIHDEFWLDSKSLPDPLETIESLRGMQKSPDLFTFTQRVPEVKPRYSFHREWENVAVVPLSTYEHWYQNQISSATRRNVRASEKRGVTVAVAEFNEEYIRGIMSIYNESPIRHGKKYWHYGKDFETVERENGTYAMRSTFLAAYYQNHIIGYLKIVWDNQTAAIMQILSKMATLGQRPNNALLAEAVKQCCLRGVKYLLYEKFVYGKKTDDSLTKFKQNNGFIRMDIPRYYIPLTLKGALAIRLGLYKGPKERLPEWVMRPFRDMRTKLYERKMVR